MKTRHKIISLSSILVMGVLAAAPAAVVSWTLVNTDQATFFSNPVLSGGSGFSNNLAATPPLNFEGITSPGTSRANHLNQPFSTITENSGNPFWGANYAYDKISHDGGSAASFRAYTTDDPSHTGEQARLDLYDSTGNYTGLINVLNGMAVGQTKSFAMTMDYRMAEKAGNGVIYMNPEFYVGGSRYYTQQTIDPAVSANWNEDWVMWKLTVTKQAGDTFSSFRNSFWVQAYNGPGASRTFQMDNIQVLEIIPEPSTIFLFGVGSVLVWRYVRRKK